MIDALTVGKAISLTREARQVIDTAAASSNINRVNAVSLDRQLTPLMSQDIRVILNASDSIRALSIAISAGNGIVGSITALQSSANLATRDSLVSPSINLTIRGTRISRLNLDSDTQRSLFLIDKLVKSSTLNHGNLISSSSPNVRITTTRFGGSIDIAPQPLDTTGLNLSGISLMTDVGAKDAASRIKSALNQATRRVNSLEALQRAVSSGNFTDQVFSSLLAKLNNKALPAGSLVNLLG